jgi:hypothetical protein
MSKYIDNGKIFLLTKRQKMTTIVVKKDYDDTIRYIYSEIKNPLFYP